MSAIEITAVDVAIHATGAEQVKASFAELQAAKDRAAAPATIPITAPGASEATAAIETAAAALHALGIGAKEASAGGMSSLVVAERDLANANSILARAGIEATARTAEQAAAFLREATAADAAAAATERAAVASRAALAGGGGGLVPPVAGLGAAGGAGGAGETGALAEEASGATLAFGGLYAQLIAVVGALEAYEKAKEFIATGVEFESTIESAKLGIAAVVTSLGTVTDAQGRALDQTHAWAAASAMADEQIQKLYGDAARTSSTVQQLVTVFQGVIGAGLSAGASLDQIRRLTVDATLAAGALNVPYSQLQVTLVELLSGHAQMRNRLTADLHLTAQQVTQWREAGTLVDNLTARFAEFEGLGTRVQGTWRGILSNVKEFGQQFAGSALSSAFATMETGVKAALSGVFSLNTGTLTASIQGAADLLRDGLGGAAKLVVSLVQATVNGLQEAGQWYERNKTAVQETGREFVALVGSVATLIGNIATISIDIVSWAAHSLVVQAVFRDLAALTGAIAENLGSAVVVITAVVAVLKGPALIATLTSLVSSTGSLGAALLALVGGPVTIAIAAVAALVIGLTAWSIAEDRARAAAVAAREATIQQATDAARLTAEFKAQAAILDKSTSSAAEKTAAQEQLKTITQQLVALSPDYQKALDDEKGKLDEQVKAIEALTEARVKDLAEKANAAAADVKALAAQQASLTATLAELGKTGADEVAFEGTRRELDAVTERLGAAKVAATQYRQAVIDAASAEAAVAGQLHSKHGGDTGTGTKDAASEAQAAIEVIQSGLAAQKAALDAALAKAELSYADYFKQLTAIEVDALQREIEVKTALLAKETDKGQRAKTEADITKLLDEQAATVQKNATARQQAEEKNADLIVRDEERVRAARGETFEATLAAIGREAEADARRRQLAGESTASILAHEQQYVSTLTAEATAKDRTAEADRILNGLALTKRQIQQQVDQGQLTEQQGADAYAAAQAKALPPLKEILATIAEIAAILHDPALADKVIELQLKIVKAGGGELKGAKSALDDLKQQVTDEFAHLMPDLSNVLGDTLGAAFSGGMQNAGKVALQGLGQIMESMGKTLLAYGLAMVGLLPALSNPFTSGPAAIAAGVILTALGAALGAIASGGSSGGAGGGSAGVGPQDTTTNITYYAPGATPAPQAAPLSAVAAVPAPRMGDVSQLRTMQPVTVTGNTFIGSWGPDVQRIMMREITEARRRGF